MLLTKNSRLLKISTPGYGGGGALTGASISENAPFDPGRPPAGTGTKAMKRLYLIVPGKFA
jgi:hypothetical protein